MSIHDKTAQDKRAREAITAILQGKNPEAGDYGGWMSIIVTLTTALTDGGIKKAQKLYAIMEEKNKLLATLMAPQEESTAQQSAEQTNPAEDCPPLPKEAYIDPARGAGACQWLDDYIGWSRKWAPEAFDEAHEGCGLFVLSTIAARRVHIPFGPRGQYTNLTIALVARTTLHTKSTAATLPKDLIRNIGLGHLLGPDKTTPEKMLSDMAGKFDLTGYDTWLPEEQERVKLRLAFAGQRGWYAEEFGMHLKAMMQDSGPYAGLYGLMLVADDCPDDYTHSTVGRGEVRVENPYLALLASMTPANLKKGGKQGAEIWQDGFFARFGFETPNGPLNEGEFPEESYSIPNKIREPLKHWHESLGTPEVTITPILDEHDKHTGEYRAQRSELLTQHCTITKDVRAALYRYRRVLRQMVAKSAQEDVDGNYGRFSTLALRMAGLFASLENGGQIEMRHWARAQTITEHMRASLHRLIGRVNKPDESPSYARKAENKIMETIKKLAEMGLKATTRNIYTYGNMGVSDARLQLSALEAIGALEKTRDGRAEVYRVAPMPEAATG